MTERIPYTYKFNNNLVTITPTNGQKEIVVNHSNCKTAVSTIIKNKKQFYYNEDYQKQLKKYKIALSYFE